MSFFVRPAGEGERYAFDGTTFTVKASGADTEGRVGVMEQAAPAGLTVPPHTHEGEDEMFYVLDGTFEFLLDAQGRDVPCSVVASPPSAAKSIQRSPSCSARCWRPSRSWPAFAASPQVA